MQLPKTRIECDRFASHRRRETQKLSSLGMSWKPESRLSKVTLIGWTRNLGKGLPPEKMVSVISYRPFPLLAHQLRRNRYSDTCPEIVEDQYEELEELSHSQSMHSQSKAFNVLSAVTAKHAGWLSRTIRENIVKEKEKAMGEIESELDVGFSDPSSPFTMLIIGPPVLLPTARCKGFQSSHR